mgnify:CR=1 FL=1
MHITLHLTEQCNMGCEYCYVNKAKARTMDEETAFRAVDMAMGSGSSVGIIFFGGEPLLHKDLIRRTIQYGEKKQRELLEQGRTGPHLHYKVTTNGLLLDEDFMEYSIKKNLFIAISHDGVREAHDAHRVDQSGSGTFDRLSRKVSLLLEYRPYAPVLMTINPDTVPYYAESVRFLYGMGFRYLICSLNYAAEWTERSLSILKKQYKLLAALSPFEVKISSHINRHNDCRERCELGRKQISVGPDGKLYPCVQFVGDAEYEIGDVDGGIREERRNALYLRNEREKDSCRDCAVRERCNHFCGCLNRQATGRIDRVSPVLCAHERILLPIADGLAEKLYKKKNSLFLQKQYNDMFPLVSMIEDFSVRK